MQIFIYQEVKFLKIPLENEDVFHNVIDTLKNKKTIPNFKWECRLYLEPDKFRQNNQEMLLVEVGMVNETLESPKYRIFYLIVKWKSC